MSELELLRETAPAPASPSPRARARARAALFTKIDASGYRRRRAWVFSASGAVATLAVAVAVFFALGAGGGQNDASAANLLHKAAQAALAQPGFDDLGPGQYIYTKSVELGMTIFPIGEHDSYSILTPSTNEVWLSSNRSGLMHYSPGKSTFVSERDRLLWIKAGRPQITHTDGYMRIPHDSTENLSSDADTLFAQLEKQARGKGSGLYTEMFVLIGDSLRSRFTTPAQRNALFEVASRLPGVELAGNVTDAVGRAGIGVAMNDGVDHSRQMLIFDPTNYGLMGEEESTLSGNWGKYPAGTVIGRVAYLEQAVVDAVKKRP